MGNIKVGVKDCEDPNLMVLMNLIGEGMESEWEEKKGIQEVRKLVEGRVEE